MVLMCAEQKCKYATNTHTHDNTYNDMLHDIMAFINAKMQMISKTNQVYNTEYVIEI